MSKTMIWKVHSLYVYLYMNKEQLFRFANAMAFINN